MKFGLLILLLPALTGLYAQTTIEREVLAVERASLDGWLKGDFTPMLAAADPGLTYFHVMTSQRLDGAAAVKQLYTQYQGRPLFDSYTIETPKVQASGDLAVLTYQLVTNNGGVVRKWQATEVYQHEKEGWKTIHTHFSAAATTQP